MIINTRHDYDALSPNEQAQFKQFLAGTIYRLEKDDSIQSWKAIEDTSTIERFGFAKADFSNVLPPELPEYTLPPSTVPAAVSMRQARLALLQAGLLAQVDAAIASMPGVDGEAARIEWEYATEVRRDSPLVDGLAAALSLTPEQLDNLFETGAAL